MTAKAGETRAPGLKARLAEAERSRRSAPADLRDLALAIIADGRLGRDDGVAAYGYCLSGNARFQLGDVAAALDDYEEARALVLGLPASARSRNIEALAIRIENDRGSALHQLGRYAEADRVFEGAHSRSRRLGEPVAQVRTLVNYGYIKSEAGRNEEALSFFTEALGLMEAAGPRSTGIAAFLPVILGNMGIAQFRLGLSESALASLDRAVEEARSKNDLLSLAYYLTSRAQALLPGQADQAEEDLAESLSICLLLGANLAGVRTALVLAGVVMDLGNLDEAEAVIAEWTPRAERCDSLRHARLIRLEGRLLSLRGRWEEAYSASEAAGELERKVGFASLQSAAIAADRGKLALRTRKLAERVEGWNESVTLTLAALIEARDAPTGGHVERTGEIVRILGGRLIDDASLPGFNRARLRLIVKSTPLHDIGKIALTDQVLKKPGPLSRDERAHIEEHVVLGKAILLDAARRIGSEPRIMTAAEIAGYHHERWDGGGYPEGLKGEAIPVSARIVAVADVYDAMRSLRPYKPALSHEAACDYIEDNAGVHFDPRVIMAFIACRAQISALYN